MHWRSVNLWEVGAALTLVGLGGLLAWEGSRYAMGTVTRMGPGFFPVWTGIVLAGVGAALLVVTLRSQVPAPPLKMRPLAAVALAVFLFMWVAPRFGLIPATAGLVFVSALADPPFRPLRTLVLAGGLALLGYLVFVQGLNVPLRAIRW